jgi:hypothetical protein
MQTPLCLSKISSPFMSRTAFAGGCIITRRGIKVSLSRVYIALLQCACDTRVCRTHIYCGEPLSHCDQASFAQNPSLKFALATLPCSLTKKAREENETGVEVVHGK